ncbi:hypothetical protein GDO81_006167 [Engystomops pustulosus]|uniref:Uncharacterized protein n=1 Tax=Engystomops pustulosus TaxID=76066 RepID=A0AAV7CUX9_ENGPU|nr:hypothetical protein GDO81_006167 [Engystomops pustulosus]
MEKRNKTKCECKRWSDLPHKQPPQGKIPELQQISYLEEHALNVRGALERLPTVLDCDYTGRKCRVFFYNLLHSLYHLELLGTFGTWMLL